MTRKEPDASQYTRRQLLALGTGLPVCARAASQGGLLEATLEPRQQRIEVGARVGNIYTYNGMSPGPLLQALPGDSVRLTLVNRLNEPTSLHFHGMHLSPSGNADNQLLQVPPGESLLTGNSYSDLPIAVVTGGWLRLRVLNASPSRFYRLRIDEPPCI